MDTEANSDVQKAEELKLKGNSAFNENKFSLANELYSQAIELSSSSAVYWANRAAARTKLQEYESALQDAIKAIEIDPGYSKGYYRRGVAYLAMRKYKEALKDFRLVINFSPNDQDAAVKLKECEKAVQKLRFEEAISVGDAERGAVEDSVDYHVTEEPNYISDKKKTSVVSTTPYSLFSIKVSVRHTVESDKHRIQSAREAYDKLVCKNLRPKKSVATSAHTKKDPIYITGFAVAEVADMVRIITSTQGIRQVLPQKCSASLKEDIDLAFKFEVMCLHEEQQHKQGGRLYWNARFLTLHCSKDLLLLEADVMSNCCKDHPFIRMADMLGSESIGMEVFLHGSPIHREGSFARGRVSNLCRDYRCFDCPNECNYDMKLIEIFGVCCSEGFSGGPIVNGNSECIGVFHASYNEYGYAISSKDVMDFLGSYYIFGLYKDDAGESNFKRRKL